MFQTSCKGQNCGEAIWMVKTASGWHPFDIENEDDKPEDGRSVEDLIDDGFTSHFDTCPDAKAFRERTKKAKKDQGDLFSELGREGYTEDA